MTPHEATEALVSLCSYIEAGRPDKSKVQSELRRIRDAVTVPRQAAQVGKFTQREYESAQSGLQALADKVMKAAKTMNPQDPSRSDLEKEAIHLLHLKREIAEGYQGISKLNV